MVEAPCADEWFSLGAGSAWVELTANFNNGWHPVDESKNTDKTLKKREAADLVFARHQIQALRSSTLVLPTTMRMEIETRTAADVDVDEPETVAVNVRPTVPVLLERPTEITTECADEGSVEQTKTEVQHGEATAAMVTLKVVRPTEVLILEQPVEPSAAALQEATARAAAKTALSCRAKILATSQRKVVTGVVTHSPHGADSIVVVASSSSLPAGMVGVGHPRVIARAAFHHGVGDHSSMVVARQVETTMVPTAPARASMITESTGTIKSMSYSATRIGEAARIVTHIDAQSAEPPCP